MNLTSEKLRTTDYFFAKVLLSLYSSSHIVKLYFPKVLFNNILQNISSK